MHLRLARARNRTLRVLARARNRTLRQWSPVFASALLVSFALCGSSVAYADASVSVELKRKDGSPIDGTVRLRKGELTLSCTTVASRCVIRGAAGGVYAVEVELRSGPSPKHRTAMIPPSGEVKLIVAVD